jgi:hypothetical protein
MEPTTPWDLVGHRLPVETLKAIVDLIDNNRDLLALALADTVLNSLATRKLYAEGITHRALESLLAGRYLATLVKTASVDDLWIPSPEEADDDLESNRNEYADLDASPVPVLPNEEQIVTVEFPLADDVLKALKRGLSNARAVLFLHLLPSLQELTIHGWSAAHWGFGFECDYFFRIFPEPWSPLPLAAGLRNLTSLSISLEAETIDGEFDPNFVVRLLALPRLLNLTIALVCGLEGWISELGPRLPELYGTSSVTDLTFNSSGIHAEVFAQLLRIPRALRSFEYHHGGWVAGEVGGWWPNEPEYLVGSIVAALSPARKTLVKLVISDEEGTRLSMAAVGSLDMFTKLVEVKLPDGTVQYRQNE